MKEFTREEILQEVEKLTYLFGLKYEIRYEQKRGDETESVAEHIYGMHILAHYFLELEDSEKKWNRERIFSMITWHDIDELETGDMIGYKKTDSDRAREEIASNEVLRKLPQCLVDTTTLVTHEYHKRETIEAKFVKAIDKIEPNFHLWNEAGKQTLMQNKTTEVQQRSIKDPFFIEFPYIRQFSEVMTVHMRENGFFYIE
jgi:5'-deoxynucleotidase YfbR-like HD superfamily hydrolase